MVPKPQRDEFKLMASTPFSAEAQHPGCNGHLTDMGKICWHGASRRQTFLCCLRQVPGECPIPSWDQSSRDPTAWMADLQSTHQPGHRGSILASSPSHTRDAANCEEPGDDLWTQGFAGKFGHRVLATKGCSDGDPISTSCPEILASENTASNPLLQNQDTEKP